MFESQCSFNELEYKGNCLYHYTDDTGAQNIFNPKLNSATFNFPDGCIALRFTRIDCMTKNDEMERRHIGEDIRAVVAGLSENGLVNTDIAERILGYSSKDESAYLIVQDEVDEETKSNVLKLGYEPVDYYVACFSFDPDNQHIIENFGSTHRIVFKNFFPGIHTLKRGIFNFIINNDSYDPFLSLNECFLDTYICKVVYSESEKYRLLRPEMYRLKESTNVEQDLQNIYARYEAFFKSTAYEEEKEIRFVITVPRSDLPNTLWENNIVLDSTREHLFVPVSKIFLAENSQSVEQTEI